MDKLGSKKRLYAGLGEYARSRRAEEMRKKYGTGNAELDRAAALQNEAAEDVELPSIAAKVKRQPLIEGMEEVNADADKWAADNEAALRELDEDEEMQKWSRKQMGK